MKGKVRALAGGGKFAVEYRDQWGAPRRETVRGSAEAHERLALRLRQVEDGTFSPTMLGRWVAPSRKAVSAPTSRLVRDVIEEVLAESRAHLRSARDDERYGKFWTDELGSRTLEEVTLEDVKRWRRRRLEVDGVAPATVNRAVSFLRKVFNHAILCGYCTKNPIHGSRKKGKGLMLPENNERAMVLTWEQQDAIRKIMKRHGYRIVVLAAQTGLRAGNLFGMRRDWIDFTYHKITIPAASFKGMRGHVVKLDSLAEEVLREILSEHDSPWVFPAKRSDNKKPHLQEAAWVRRVWEPACTRAGVEGVKWHDLRATCATRMLENGATLEEVRDQLGHSTLAMVQRYARIVESHHRASLERVATRARGLGPVVSDSVSDSADFGAGI